VSCVPHYNPDDFEIMLASPFVYLPFHLCLLYSSLNDAVERGKRVRFRDSRAAGTNTNTL